MDNKPIGNSTWIDVYDLDPKLHELDKPECEFKGCKETATMWFRVVCCRQILMMCDEHVEETLYQIKSLKPGKGYECKHCSVLWDSLDFIEIPRLLDATLG